MSVFRPFRFGITTVSAGSATDWGRKARRIEELGYSTLLVWDHLGEQLAPMPALMAAACATRALRVGTYVLCNDFRHPAILAKEAATLDMLSDGRFELGIGAGWQEDEYEQIGLTFDPARVRVARLTEAVQILKGLLSGQVPSITGEHYRLQGLRGTPLPLQRPHPPLMIGGARPQVLRLAAQEADIVSFKADILPAGTLNVRGTSVAALTQRVRYVREQARPRASMIELQVRIQQLTVTEDRAAAAQRLAAQYGCEPEDILNCVYLLVGNHEQIMATLHERRQQLGISYLVFHEAVSEQFGPIAAALTGA